MKKTILIILPLLGSFVYSQTTFVQNSISYPTCFGTCDGSVVFSTTTTPGPFTAVLSNTSSCPNTTVQSSVGNTITISGLCTCVSDYSVNFYNSSMVLVGFELLQIPITATSALVLQTPTTNPAVCSSCCDGSVYVSYSGGYLPPPNSATVTLDGNNVGLNYFPIPTVCVGQHTVCVKDMANCVVCTSFSMNFVPNVGVAQNDPNIMFTFFPNPANDKITLTSTSGEFPQEVRFLDMTGKVNDSRTITSVSFEINISTLPKGVHIIEMVTSKRIIRQKLIKLE